VRLGVFANATAGSQPVIELIDGLPKNVVGIFVTGRVSRQDCRDVLVPAMDKALKRHDKIRLYYVLGSRFPGSAWDELDLGSERAGQCERVAIVTDIAWVRLTVKALRFLIPSEIRVFPTLQTVESRAWITARNSTKRQVHDPRQAPMRSRPQRRAGPTPHKPPLPMIAAHHSAE